MKTQPFFAYRSFQPELSTVRAMAAQGVDTICLTTANTLNSVGTPYCLYGPTWLADGVYDFSAVDRQFGDVLKINPEFKIICNVDLNTPDWAVHRWTDNSDYRPDSFNDLGRVASDSFWRKKTRDYPLAFLRHTQKHYARNIIRYGMFCGRSTEWYDNSQGQESPSRREAWRAWCNERGFGDPVDVPPASVRETSAHGILRDPCQDAVAIRYLTFCNWQIGDAILYFAKAARSVIGRRAGLGVFYGYMIGPGRGVALLQGHMELDRVVRSGLIDFVMAPALYGPERHMGGASGCILPVDTLAHNRVEHIHEIDHRTPSSNEYLTSHITLPFDHWPDEASTIAGLRREVCYSIVRGSSLWLFDMWGHFYDGDNVKREIGRMRRLWRANRDRRAEPAAEIAYFTDATSWLHCNPYAELYPYGGKLAEALGHIGAPVASYSLADLETLDTEPFKLILLPHLFVVDKQRLRLLQRKVLRDGKTVLWCDRPGVVRNGKYNLRNVQKLTGLPAGKKGIATAQMDGWRSVLAGEAIAGMETPTLQTAQVLRRIALEAGVHMYLDTGEPIYANRELLAVHSAAGGRRMLRLPEKAQQVRELFSGKVVARDTDAFEYDLPSPSTVLFELRPPVRRRNGER